MAEVLAGRAGIITGAAGGIGQVLVREFTAAGAWVAAFDTVASDDRDAYEVDITDQEAVEAATADFVSRTGRLDFLINNAGVRHQAAFLDHPLDAWRRTLDVNMTGTFICSQAAVKRFGDDGRIVNIASIAGVLGLKNRIAYSASKAGIVGMTRAMAFELGERGVRVNAIGPGVIETPLTASYFEDADFAQLIRSNVPLGRWGQPDDLAGTAIFLCGPGAEYVSGQVLCVDGGWVAGKGY
jgi:gluconate 5-dehydrogenase